MTQRSWSVDLPDGAHTIELDHGPFSGRIVVRVDGGEVRRRRQLWDPAGIDERVPIGDREGLVQIRHAPGGYAYEFSLLAADATAPPPRFAPLGPDASLVTVLQVVILAMSGALTVNAVQRGVVPIIVAIVLIALVALTVARSSASRLARVGAVAALMTASAGLTVAAVLIQRSA